MQTQTLPKFDVRKQLARVKWREILIGDLNRIDVGALVMGRAVDILLCGIGAAFILLISFAALLLPNELRVIVWMGCAFLLVTVVDGPSWNRILDFPLTVMIITIGAVAFSGLAAGLDTNATIYVVITYALIPVLSVSLGILVAFYIAEGLIEIVSIAFGLTPQHEEVYELRKLLRKEFGIRTSLRKIEKNGMFTLAVRSAPVRLADHLGAISKTLHRPVAAGGSDGRGRLLLIVMPPGSIDDATQ